MKLLIIRHCDPDYENDTLTEKGFCEAKCLAERLAKTKIDYAYVSPLGRAKDTARIGLGNKNIVPVECDWLREFPAEIDRPDGIAKITWDWLPEDWTKDDKFFDKDRWLENEIISAGNVKEEYEKVSRGLEELLNRHGYHKEGNLYIADKPNNDCIALFCHFGLECVLLSRLLNISPMQLWHGFCAAPSSVTTLATEERREKKAYFRMLSFGDQSHLYANDEDASFAARFCECYANLDERHD